MENDNAFRSKVTDSLEAVAGAELRAVNYAVLSSDEPHFMVDSPNDCGVCSVIMCFDNNRLKLWWGWERSLRSEDTHYHIQTLLEKSPKVSDPGYFVNAVASNSALWHNVLNSKLQGIEVHGIEGTPQAVRFVFPLAAVVIVVGNSGRELSIGDGDEMLILSDEDWSQEVRQEQCKSWNDGHRRWSMLWELSSHDHA